MPRFYFGDDQQILTGVLFVLFAFLMLQPTINPWYWVWAVPFTCFTSRWGWIGISAVLTVYYTKFFFESSDLVFAVNDNLYSNVEIFDHFVVWGEAMLITMLILFAGRLDSVKPNRHHSAT